MKRGALTLSAMILLVGVSAAQASWTIYEQDAEYMVWASGYQVTAESGVSVDGTFGYDVLAGRWFYDAAPPLDQEAVDTAWLLDDGHLTYDGFPQVQDGGLQWPARWAEDLGFTGQLQAFQQTGYVWTERAGVFAIPEPQILALFVLGFLMLKGRKHV